MFFLSAADPALFSLFAVVHIAGLVSVFMTRVPGSHRRHAICHHGFLACLVFVGLATLGTIVVQSNWWVWSGTTFALMAIGATTDLAPVQES